MKYPKTLKVGAHKFKLVTDKIHDEFMGQTDFTNRTIHLDRRLVGTPKFSTLIHELFHAMNSTLSSDTKGHALCDSLAEQMAQVLLDNKFVK